MLQITDDRVVFEGVKFIIIDVTDLLPKNKNWPKGSFHIKQPWNGQPAVNGAYYDIKDRKVEVLYLHQTAGSVTEEGFEAVHNTTAFVVRDPAWVQKPNPKTGELEWVWTGRGRGWPGCCYTFYIPWKPLIYRGKIVIFQCNRIDSVTWHSSDNKNSIACVCQGYFKSRYMRSFSPPPGQTGSPNAVQLEALEGFVKEYAIGKLGIKAENVRGHCDSPHPKPTCPGDTIEGFYRSLQNSVAPEPPSPAPPAVPGMLDLQDWKMRQAALAYLGHDLGQTGQQGNGVDGDPGRFTRLAIEAQEEKFGLKKDGYWDDTFDFVLKMYLLALGVSEADLKALM